MPVKQSQPADLEPIERASRDELTALQLQRLQWTLRHAYENVPHYRAAFSLYRFADRRFWRSYVRVFTNSEEVKRRVVSANLVDSSRVEVAYHGVDGDRWRPDGRREKT